MSDERRDLIVLMHLERDLEKALETAKHLNPDGPLAEAVGHVHAATVAKVAAQKELING